MKTSEKLIAVEDYLSVKGVALEDFYNIEITSLKVALQGKFEGKKINALKDTHPWGFGPSGYVETKIDVPAEDQEIIPVTITLT